MSQILDRLHDARNAIGWVRDRLALLQYPSDPRQDLRLALKLIDRAEVAIRKEQARVEAREATRRAQDPHYRGLGDM